MSKIIQIIPCSNVWIRYKDTDNPGKYFYSRAECLALVEDEEGYRDIGYIDMDDYGITAGTGDNFDGIVHSTEDLTLITNYLGKSKLGASR